MMSIKSNPYAKYDLLKLRTGVMNVELIYSDPIGQVPYKDQFKQIISKAKQDLDFTDTVLSHVNDDFEGPRSCSFMARQFVRKWPIVTRDGREFA